MHADEIGPMVTWGNSPEDALPISGRGPDPRAAQDPRQRDAMTRTLTYMGLAPGTPLTDIAVDRVFLGSCTNGRIEDLRSAAAIAQGRHVAKGVQAWVVPGSGLVKAQAEREGLDKIFREAGFDCRNAGCSLCMAHTGELVAPHQRSAPHSTPHRPEERRVGEGGGMKDLKRGGRG